MGAKKTQQSAVGARTTRCAINQMKTRLRDSQKISRQVARKRSLLPTPKSKALPDSKTAAAAKKDQKDLSQKSTKATMATTTSHRKSNIGSTSDQSAQSTTVVKSCASSSVPSMSSPQRKSSALAAQQNQKPNEEKSKALNKMLKNLDIKISGFSHILQDEQKAIECNASISEIVKTKSRAAAARVGSGGSGRSHKKDDSGDGSRKNSQKSESDSGEECKSDDVKVIQKAKEVKICEEPTKSKTLLAKEGTEAKGKAKVAKKDVERRNVSKTVAKGADESLAKSETSEATDGKVLEREESSEMKITEKATKDECKELKSEVETKRSVAEQPKKCHKTPPDKKGIKKAAESADATKEKPNKKVAEKAKQDAEESKQIKKVAKQQTPKKVARDTNTAGEQKNVKLNAKKQKELQTSVKILNTTSKAKQKANQKPKESKKNEPPKTTNSISNEDNASQNESQRKEKESQENLEKPSGSDQKKLESPHHTAKEKRASKSSVISQESAAKNSINITATLLGSLPETLSKDAETSKKTPSPPVTTDPTAADAASEKLLSVRQRLQKKYLHDKGICFKTYKTTKPAAPKKSPSPKLKKTEVKPPKAVVDEPKPVVDDRTEEIVDTKKEKDIYDFKTESESDDNIKMNLLSDAKLVSKFVPASQLLAERAEREKEFSDEDDRPLHLTKLQLEDEEDEKPLSQSREIRKVLERLKEEKPATPIKTEKIEKVIAAKEKKTPVKVAKKTPVPKRKEKSETSNSSGSESESECEDRLRIQKRRQVAKKITFVPKRHRMASLNALAKVQCLYENESRTAHELGLSKSSQAPKIRTINSCSSSEEEKDAEKADPAKNVKVKEDPDKKLTPIVEVDKKEPSSEGENKRELRNAPGLRGVGKHWEFNDVSSFESGHDTDFLFRRDSDEKPKTKKRKVPKPKVPKTQDKEKAQEKEVKPKKTVKYQKKKPRAVVTKETSESSEDEETRKNIAKRKRNKTEDPPAGDFKEIVASKRMASLNASALMAATYEVERHLDRNFDSDCSSFESYIEDEKPKMTNAKKLKDIKVDLAEEANKESSRPTSSSVVIVQDTDVTITGVYVNSSTGSSQEAYCKMQYRVQSSVTEERVLRPNSIDPPKSYTPLGALSSMRPPGAGLTEVGMQHQRQHQQSPLSSMVPQHPSGQSNIYQPSVINQDPNVLPPPSHGFGGHQHQGVMSPLGSSASAHHHQLQEQQMHLHHQQHHQQLQQHYQQHHHHHPGQPPPPQTRCESPMRYQPSVYPTVQPPMPPPPLSMSGGGSSAFCAPLQQSHHDMSGYYQPAGPLISPHVLPPVPPSNAALVSTKQVPSPLDSDPDQLQQPPQSTSTAESSDSEVLITGGDLTTFRYPTSQQASQSTLSSQQHQQQQQQQQQQQSSAYSRSMHQMHYSPAYPPSYYSPYPGEAMCYSPPYQPYFPAKVYQSAPAYRRYPSYYQPGPPPADLYEPPPPSSAPPPPPTGSQLVPAGPSAPQHMEHYPGPPGFYSAYSPGGGQCYSRGMQPPYMDYPAPCPCPMQSCPKNVLTGPLIGSNNSNTMSSSNSASNNSNMSTMNNSISSSNNSMTNSSSGGSSLTNSAGHHQLKTNKGPGAQHQSAMKTHLSTNGPATMGLGGMVGHKDPTNAMTANGSGGIPLLNSGHHHHHHIQCKMEVLETAVKSEPKIEIKDSLDSRKNSQYEDVVIPPTPPPSGYTVNDKLIEPEITVSPARGSTGLPTVPDQLDNAAVIPPSAAVGPTAQSMKTLQTDGETVVGGLLQPAIGRKARIGKSMAREMMYGAHGPHHNHPHLHPQVFTHNHMQHHTPPHAGPDITSVTHPLLLEPATINGSVVKQEIEQPAIKKEEIKMEEEDDVVFLEDEKQDLATVKIEPEIVEVIDDKTDEELPVKHINGLSDVIHEIDDSLSDDLLPHPGGAKRMNILAGNKGQCKKSPPSSYKSLIKQTEPKPYLCLTKQEKRARLARKLAARNGFRKRKLVLTDQQKRRLILRKRKLMMMEKRRKAVLDEAKSRSMLPSSSSSSSSVGGISSSTNHHQVLPEQHTKISTVPVTNSASIEGSEIIAIDRIPAVSRANPGNHLARSALEYTIDCVARGYFSEPEVRSATARKAKKTKITEARSKSETKKPADAVALKSHPIEVSTNSTSSSSATTQIKGSKGLAEAVQTDANSTSEAASTKESAEKTNSKPKDRKPGKTATSASATPAESNGPSNSEEQEVSSSPAKFKGTPGRKPKKHTAKARANSKSKVKTKPVMETAEPEPPECLDRVSPPANHHHNNNNVLEHNKNREDLTAKLSQDVPVSVPSEAIIDPAAIATTTTTTMITTTTGKIPATRRATFYGNQSNKRARSRSTKFGSRKRQRTSRHSVTEVEETAIVPRKSNVVPRWNNGWSWEGEPFQGKVFLNSDDPVVIRTCYPAMRHSEGDVIRPRDCVLLRAGSKKNELPYVAKVAHLWENPDDGEMMMSLLWYYRPEHTEQGRQPADCPDEVFASRHRDHNSVACIEDKCYVLTFSEYCRYRRSVRGSEEGIEEEQSIVPQLQNYYNPREVPVQTNPEQVMFCQRVYEFRLKRLMKTPTS